MQKSISLCSELVCTLFPQIVSAETIQGRKLIKGGNYFLLGGFDRRNYSREETVLGRKYGMFICMYHKSSSLNQGSNHER